MNGFQLDLAKLKRLRGRTVIDRSGTQAKSHSNLLPLFQPRSQGSILPFPTEREPGNEGGRLFYVSSGSLSLVPVNERTVNMVYFIDSCISRTDLSSLFNATLKDG